ncbi:MAG TPA: glycosyltransferase family 39 protein [Gammaproteobacteria bacterium]|jgi:4-amino-4-deoxy-L-arabinose transferase-like glycosyltransferase|nr:glycosyltransferase family 39 protein [Gammaproteobacteria bacterium]
MSARAAALVLGLLLIVSFLGVTREPWTPDEPREAEVSREMWLSPSVVPSLNDATFVEKPPLYYWTVAGVFELAGKQSATAARAVSGAAAFLTLLLVYFWGRREFSSMVGILAAVGLATSVQFMISTHWIVMDPLLMLFTTVAVWAGSLLVQGRGRGGALLAFYGALTLALWTKGLIGPVLVATGVLAYALACRSLVPVWRVKPFLGVAVMVAMTGVIAGLIYVDAGADAVREWLWVNHVQRFVHPTYTGHDQPFYYYLSALPIAVFPWLVPFLSILRPSRWRGSSVLPASWSPARVYLGALSLGMVLLLSASSTKRGLYLLPVLPPLFLLLATEAVEWWQRRSGAAFRSVAWWAQLVLVAGFAAGPIVFALRYLHSKDAVAVATLVIIALLTGASAIFAYRGRAQAALGALGALATASVVGLVVVVVYLAAPERNMSAFLRDLDRRLAPGEPVVLVGDVDESVNGIVPFVTERRVVLADISELAARQPLCVLVQNNEAGRTAPTLPAPYERKSARLFGPERYMAFWCRGADPPAAANPDETMPQPVRLSMARVAD